MRPKQFRKKVLLYGVDLHQWPEEIRQAAMESLQHSPELQVILAEEEGLERALKARKYEEPSGNMPQRIASLSLQKNRRPASGLDLFLPRLFGDAFYLPKPARVVVCILMITALVAGFAIGVSSTTGSGYTDQRQVNLQDFLHYEEAKL